MMSFEERCLAIAKSVTKVDASFFNGTMFLETQDASIVNEVYRMLSGNNQTVDIFFGKSGIEATYYDFA